MYPFFLDSTFLLVLPALVLAIWAQIKVTSTYARYSSVGTRTGLSGAEVAQYILRDAGVDIAHDPQGHARGATCGLETIPGRLTDHYDPRTRMLRLSQDIYYGRSIAALGIAAHETGHAIQHARLYGPLMLRNVIYPVCNFGSGFAFPLFFLGLFMHSGFLIQLGIMLFTLAVCFTVLTLPVEFNASRRALQALASGGYLDEDELRGARKVLSAAAMTYVAAAAMAALQLLRMLILARNRH